MADRAGPAQKEDITPSFKSRIAQSASGLARDLVSSSGRTSITSALAANVADSGKGFASSSRSFAGPSTWEQQRPATGVQDAAASQGAAPRESFRSASLRYHAWKQLERESDLWRRATDAFVQASRIMTNAGAATVQPSYFGARNLSTERADYDEAAERVEAAWIKQYQTSSKGKGKAIQSSADIPQQTTSDGTPWAWINDFNVSDHGQTRSDRGDDQTYVADSRHTMPNENDGAEVVSLLSNPQFTVGIDTLEAEIHDVADVSAEDLFGGSMTDGEERATQRIKSALPPPPEHGLIAPQNPLNLRPNFGPMVHEYIEEINTNMSYLLNTWDSNWDEVLNHYTDAVWGSSVPQVKEAKEQFKEILEGGKPADTQAVRRLEMILSHLRLPEVNLGLRHKRPFNAEIEAAQSTAERPRSEASVLHQLENILRSTIELSHPLSMISN